AARRLAGAARTYAVRARIHGGQSRSCTLAAPAVPCRRLAALRAGLAQHARLARLLARPYIHPRRHVGCFGGAGRPGAPAARDQIAGYDRHNEESTPWVE